MPVFNEQAVYYAAAPASLLVQFCIRRYLVLRIDQAFFDSDGFSNLECSKDLERFFAPFFAWQKRGQNERSDVRVSKICAIHLRKCCSHSRLTPDSLRFPTLSSASGKAGKAIIF
jgi:hypothetical protein